MKTDHSAASAFHPTGRAAVALRPPASPGSEPLNRRSRREDTPMASQVRRAVFAGSWYPARASECEREIQAFVERGGLQPLRRRRLVGGLLPHAGWYFSGSIACNVVHALRTADGPTADVLVVFGMHLSSSSPNIMMPTGAWETPFGTMAVAEELAEALIPRFAFRLETPDRFTQDNTIELQLPFLKYFFPQAKVLAIGVPGGGRCGSAAGAHAQGHRFDRSHPLRQPLWIHRARERPLSGRLGEGGE
jgi:hypothetical protein